MSEERPDRSGNRKDYFAWRAAECLRMAEAAAEPGAATIHRRLAEQYAAKADAL